MSPKIAPMIFAAIAIMLAVAMMVLLGWGASVEGQAPQPPIPRPLHPF